MIISTLNNKLIKSKASELSESDIESLNRLLKLSSKLILHKDNNKLNPQLIDKCDELGVKIIRDLPHIAMSYYLSLGDIQEIHISENPLSCVFAHEIGHAIARNSTGIKLEKISFNLYALSSILTSLSSAISIITGYVIGASGKSIQLRKLTYGSAAAVLAPYIINKPVLYQENFASKTAIKLMKDYGASDEYLKLSEVTLKAAYQTYKNSRLLNSILSGLGYSSAYLVTSPS